MGSGDDGVELSSVFCPDLEAFRFVNTVGVLLTVTNLQVLSNLRRRVIRGVGESLDPPSPHSRPQTIILAWQMHCSGPESCRQYKIASFSVAIDIYPMTRGLVFQMTVCGLMDRGAKRGKFRHVQARHSYRTVYHSIRPLDVVCYETLILSFNSPTCLLLN
jgi:hypothetical protein